MGSKCDYYYANYPSYAALVFEDFNNEVLSKRTATLEDCAVNSGYI